MAEDRVHGEQRQRDVARESAASVQDGDGALPLLKASRRAFRSSRWSSPTAAIRRESSGRRTDPCGDRAKTAPADRLRRPCTALGRRAVLRLDQPEPRSGEGRRSQPRLRHGLSLRRLRHAPRASHRSEIMSFKTASKAQRRPPAPYSPADPARFTPPPAQSPWWRFGCFAPAPCPPATQRYLGRRSAVRQTASASCGSS